MIVSYCLSCGTLYQVYRTCMVGISIAIRCDDCNYHSGNVQVERRASALTYQVGVICGYAANAAAGCQLVLTHDGASEWIFVTPDAFVIRQTDEASSGLGAFATRSIKRGDCILSEAPLVQWTLQPDENTTAGLVSLVNALDPADYSAYCSLCQNPIHGSGGKSVYGIWLSNAYLCTSPLQATRDRQHGVDEDRIQGTKAVFVSACRFNHSCSPNAHVSWNAKRGQQVIYALSTIEPGTEICVSYLDNASGMRRAQRHEELGFACTCCACRQGGVAQEQSDKRRARIGAIFGLLEATIRAADRRAIALISERLTLMEQEEMREDWNTLFCGYSYFELRGDPTEARAWAARAAESVRHGMGVDSDEFQHYVTHAKPPNRRGGSLTP